MNIKNNIKRYWRIYILLIFIVASLTVVFSPVVPFADFGSSQEVDDPSIDQQVTSLQYGIELAGGTRIRAPLMGQTAEDVDIGPQDPTDVERLISQELNNTDSTQVVYRGISSDRDTADMEVTSDVTESEYQDALDEHDIQYNNIRPGVTDETIDETVEVMQTKLDEAGMTGGDVRIVSSGSVSERDLILVSVPNVDRQETIRTITERGEVRVDIYHFDQEQDEYVTREAVLERDDFRTIGTAQPEQDGRLPHVPVTLNSDSAERFQDDVVETGVAQPRGSTCRFETNPENTDSCLLTVVDGEVINSFGMSPSLASSMTAGTWSDDPSFILQAESFEEAQGISVNLRAGSLPAQPDVDDGDITFVSPEQGAEFRLVAVIIGLLASLTVAFIVSARYKNKKIAAPMLITAFSEIIILLAIASIIQYPIDIAVIAGFIAVIGTGVDDLIIITDKVMKNGKATGKKLFTKRFRSALWIIMSAAGTTILALVPLAALELQQLRGFAIFTILGVIAGVLITRPAYGDMLRYFFQKDYSENN